jgi:hypothetical protein
MMAGEEKGENRKREGRKKQAPRFARDEDSDEWQQSVYFWSVLGGEFH